MYIQPELSKYTGRVIYKLIAPDKRVYIGKATTSYKRIKDHKYEAFAKKDGKWKHNTRWKKAIREFGWENLLVEILEFVPKWTSLDKRERYWIAEYHASDPKYGFNMNEGGAGPTKHTSEAKAKMSAALMGMGSKPVTCCEILEDGEMQKVKLTSYESATAAEADLGIDNTNISACCHGKRNSAGGYLWWFTKEDEVFGERTLLRVGDVPMPGNEMRMQAVISVLSRGNGQADEQLHASMSESKRTLSATGKKFSIGAISGCCRHERKSHQGYNFRRVTTEKREDFGADFKRTVPYNPELYTIKKR